MEYKILHQRTAIVEKNLFSQLCQWLDNKIPDYYILECLWHPPFLSNLSLYRYHVFGLLKEALGERIFFFGKNETKIAFLLKMCQCSTASETIISIWCEHFNLKRTFQSEANISIWSEHFNIKQTYQSEANISVCHRLQCLTFIMAQISLLAYVHLLHVEKCLNASCKWLLNK